MISGIARDGKSTLLGLLIEVGIVLRGNFGRVRGVISKQPDEGQHQMQFGALLVAAKATYLRGARGKISQFGRQFFAGQHPYPPNGMAGENELHESPIS
jgi:hypothetical protein